MHDDDRIIVPPADDRANDAAIGYGATGLPADDDQRIDPDGWRDGRPYPDDGDDFHFDALEARMAIARIGAVNAVVGVLDTMPRRVAVATKPNDRR